MNSTSSTINRPRPFFQPFGRTLTQLGGIIIRLNYNRSKVGYVILIPNQRRRNFGRSFCLLFYRSVRLAYCLKKFCYFCKYFAKIANCCITCYTRFVASYLTPTTFEIFQSGPNAAIVVANDTNAC